jgi:hypothetical protein
MHDRTEHPTEPMGVNDPLSLTQKAVSQHGGFGISCASAACIANRRVENPKCPSGEFLNQVNQL